MPTYEYGCEACGKTWELEQRITEAPIKQCPECGKLEARRLISGGTFMLKGGGWYADGYGSKPAKAEGKSDKSETKSETTKSDSAKSDSTKSESKSESKAASSGASDS